MSFLFFTLLAVSSTFNVAPQSVVPGIFEVCPIPVTPTL